MNEREAQSIVKSKLSKDRYEHTLRVAQTAKQLAEIFNASTKKAVLAGLLHDYAKCNPPDELKEQIKHFRLPKHLLHYHKELWHGPVGAKIIKEEYMVTDEDIFHAIYYHTTARENMSLLEKIIYVADYIEPGRKFPGVEEVRKLAEVNLDLATHRAIRNSMIHLLKKDAIIFPDTFLAYNQLTKIIGGVK